MWKRLFWLVSLLVLTGQAHAQLSSKRCKWVKVTSAPFHLDSLTLLPGTVQFFKGGDQPLRYEYNASTNQFQLQNADGVDSVLVCYRVLPLNLATVKRRRNAATLDSATFERNYYAEDFSVKEELFRTPGLNKTGTISRGISFGNTQNVFVNSALNLQLEGKLSEDISITGTISDQNIPVQPEGNTQQLQQFDRIYLTLTHPRWTVTAGDIVLRNKPSNFLRFYKNVQGGYFEYTTGKTPERNSATVVAASVAKGRFASITLPPIEGVQGPYRLRGPEGERFIIVMANSERVYLDGRLLVRGFDFDYTIDYNLAEITFTPKNLVLKNSRIRVDFEYAVQNYTRTIQHLSHYQSIDRLKVQFNVYQEADNPNQPVGANLNQAQKLKLREVGDSLELAVVPGADSVKFSRNQVLYQKADTTWLAGDGQTYRIYRYQLDSTRASAFFDVRFTEVGTGLGDYDQLTGTSVNGRVFHWVGKGQGRYMPVRQLAAPGKKQMVTVGASYQVDKFSSVFVEAATSQNDLNRYSPKDAADDKGQAVKTGFVMEGRPLGSDRGYKLRSSLDYEYDTRHFTGIDRFRDIEFERNWSVNANRRAASDNILNFSLGAVKDPLNLVNYRISRRFRAGEVAGLQHWLDLSRQFGKLEVTGTFFLLASEKPKAQSDWQRGTAGIRYNSALAVPGYTYRFDQNRVRNAAGDTLLSSAIYFDEHTFFVQSQDTASTRYRIDHSFRQDRFFTLGELRKPERAQTTNGSLSTHLGENNTLDLLATYRQRQPDDSLGLPQPLIRTVMGKADWSSDLLQRHLRSELSYSVATGRELKRDYQFLPAPNGGATHYWQDVNGNGIQERDEFFLAEPPATPIGTYIKIYVPTDQYVLAYTNRFTYRLNSSLPRSWNGKAGIPGFLARFSAVNFISIDKKTTDEKLMARLNPLSNEVREEDLLSISKQFRNTVYFNRTHPKFGLEVTWLDNEQKQLLVNGSEARTLEEQSVNYRHNLSEVFSMRLNALQRQTQNRSNYLLNRNFRIEGFELSLSSRGSRARPGA